MRYALDTSIWLYTTTSEPFAEQVAGMGLWPIGLSAVVASELSRRALSAAALAASEQIIERWRHALLAPTVSDWLLAAGALRELRTRHRYEPRGLSRLQNDALIAISCARAGWTVVTTNRSDFERLGATLGSRAPAMLFLAAPAPP